MLSVSLYRKPINPENTVQLDGVFMDMYGTITTGDRQAVENVCVDLVRDTAIPMTPTELSVYWGDLFFAEMEQANHDRFATLFDVEARTLRDAMRRLNIDLEPETYVRQLTAYWQDPPLQPEVREFLAAFPLPICIVSNADRLDVDRALRTRDIRVHHVVTSEDVRAYKPDPRIFEIALQQTGWNPERTIHIGDSVHSDVGGAHRAGIRCAWLNRAHRIYDVGSEETPDWEIENLLELLPLLNGRVPA